MSVVAAIRDMLASGFTVEQALKAAEIMEQSIGGPKSNAQRQAEWRERQKARRNESNESNDAVTTVTQSHKTETAHTYAEPEPKITTPSPVQKDILSDIPKVPVAKSADGFDEMWAIYPRRQGGNSRKNAEASFRKAVKAGVPAETIIDGVRAYAEHCDATRKTGTEFVKTAEAWLNGRFWESDWSISLSRPAPPFRQAKPNTALDGLTSIRRRFSDGNSSLQLDGRSTGGPLLRIPG